MAVRVGGWLRGLVGWTEEEWVAGWVECGGGLDLVLDGAKNMAERSERALIVELYSSFMLRKCCSGNFATRSCHTFWEKFLHDKVDNARRELAARSAEKCSTLRAS